MQSFKVPMGKSCKTKYVKNVVIDQNSRIFCLFWPFLPYFTGKISYFSQNPNSAIGPKPDSDSLLNNSLCSIPPSWAPPDINIMTGESCESCWQNLEWRQAVKFLWGTEQNMSNVLGVLSHDPILAPRSSPGLAVSPCPRWQLRWAVERASWTSMSD